ncbi:MAG: hypothetical protein IJM15_03455 [Erysipelotrichaceae bacterium]|nr:hypothetical protein [Erysipelotrichaceae bacterium]
MNNWDIARAFLSKYHQLPEGIDLKRETDEMVRQMLLGLHGEDSSLMMIPTYLSTEGQVVKNKPVVAIDAGGTNLRIALVSFTEEGLKIENLMKRRMFGVDEAISGEKFIEGLTELLVPLIEKSDKIGFCFSFASETLPNMDGKVIDFGKDVKITGAVGMLLGEEIRKCLREKGYDKDISVVVLNDTVSTLLGGPAIPNAKDVDGQIGLIVGTGTNTAYCEDINEITKIDYKGEGKMIINMESAGFDGFELGEFERRVDAKSSNRGKALFEKCISGMYLGSVIGETLKQAAAEGLFSEGNTVSELKDFSMAEVDAFLRDPYGGNMIAKAAGNENDTDLIYQFIDLAIDRASRLITVNLAACIERMNGGRSISSPVRIMAEGSTLLKCFGYRQRVEYYMHQFVTLQLGHYYYFTEGVDINMAGSAIAALVNG